MRPDRDPAAADGLWFAHRVGGWRRGTQRVEPEVAIGELRQKVRTRLVTRMLRSGSLLAFGWVALGGANLPHFRVSQKNQSFTPSSLTIPQGTVVDLVNDDGDVLHHAYVDSPTFKFDSGDQEPGTVVPLAFNVAGTFTVLCGIHPRMKLKVRVESTQSDARPAEQQGVHSVVERQ